MEIENSREGGEKERNTLEITRERAKKGEKSQRMGQKKKGVVEKERSSNQMNLSI